MPGASDFFEQGVLNYLSGSLAMPALPPIFLGLFTVAPTSDAGTGGTEVTTVATNYARQQIAGSLTTNATTASGNNTLHFASVPSWILGPSGTGVVGMQIRDATSAAVIPANTTLVSATATTVVMSNNAAGAGVGGTDVITFSCFAPAVASANNPEPTTTPGSITNTNAIVTMNQSTGSWGTVIFFGLFDAVTSGDYLAGDYIGAFNWIPFTCSSATPGVLTTDVAGDVPTNGSSVVVTAKYGGTLPTGMTGSGGLLTTAGASANTFNVGVNTTSTGAGEFRQVTQQIIGNNTTPSFATGQLTVKLA